MPNDGSTDTDVEAWSLPTDMGSALRTAVTETPPGSAELHRRSSRRRALAVLIVVVGILAGGVAALTSRDPADPVTTAAQGPDEVMPFGSTASFGLEVRRVEGWTLLVPTGWQLRQLPTTGCSVERRLWWISPPGPTPDLTKSCVPVPAPGGPSGVVLEVTPSASPPRGLPATTTATAGAPVDVSGYATGAAFRLRAVGPDGSGDLAAIIQSALGPPRGTASDERTSTKDDLVEAMTNAGVDPSGSDLPAIPSGFSLLALERASADPDTGIVITLVDDAMGPINDRFVDLCVAGTEAAARHACSGPRSAPGFTNRPADAPGTGEVSIGTADLDCWLPLACVGPTSGRTWTAVRVRRGNLSAGEVRAIFS
jgi:hypothetical protein